MSLKSSNAWLLQRVTGVGLVVLLGLHFGIEHFLVGAHKINASNTVERMSQGIIEANRDFLGITLSTTIDIPAILYQSIAILLLGFSVYHGMYGLYGVLLEQGFSHKTQKGLKYFFVFLSVALFIQGILIFYAFTGMV